MALDLSSLVLMLAAVIGWVSLVTVEFYEKIYSSKITAHQADFKKISDELQRSTESEFSKVLTNGKAPLDEAKLQNSKKTISSLRNAEKDLTGMRKTIFKVLGFAGVATFLAVLLVNLDVSQTFLGADLRSEAVAVSLGLSGLVFFYGLYFLWRMFWFDEHIRKFTQAEAASPVNQPTILGPKISDAGENSALFVGGEKKPRLDELFG